MARLEDTCRALDITKAELLALSEEHLKGESALEERDRELAAIHEKAAKQDQQIVSLEAGAQKVVHVLNLPHGSAFNVNPL